MKETLFHAVVFISKTTDYERSESVGLQEGNALHIERHILKEKSCSTLNNK